MPTTRCIAPGVRIDSRNWVQPSIQPRAWPKTEASVSKHNNSNTSESCTSHPRLARAISSLWTCLPGSLELHGLPHVSHASNRTASSGGERGAGHVQVGGRNAALNIPMEVDFRFGVKTSASCEKCVGINAETHVTQRATHRQHNDDGVI